MTSTPTITASAPKPDGTDRARQLIELGLALDPEARSEKLARLIAASIHTGAGTALEQFAATGELIANDALRELGAVQVPLEQESWIDALGHFIITGGNR